MNLQPVITVRFTDDPPLNEVETLTAIDPFGVDDPCPFSATGHDALASCGEVICVHCSKIFWG